MNSYNYCPYALKTELDTKADVDFVNIQLNNKANLDLSNISTAGSNKILKTGYVKAVNSGVYTGEGITSQRTFTLSFLPNDGGVYEVFFSAGFTTTNDGLSNLVASSNLQNMTAVCATNNKFTVSGNVSVITNNRQVSFWNEKYAGGVTNQIISAMYYRKIGVNL